VSQERIRIGDQYYLLASALAPTRPRRLLNHGDSFAIFDLSGDVPLAALEPFGVFHRGTRYLDRLELRVNGNFPVLLSSSASDDGSEIVAYLTNADERRGEEVVLERDTVGIQRRKTLIDGAVFESLHLQNFGSQRLRLEITLQFGADFADVFELRGVAREKRGELQAPQVQRNCLCFGYLGRDELRRETVIAFSRPPESLDASTASFAVSLEPGAVEALQVRIECRDGSPLPAVADLGAALAHVRGERLRSQHELTSVRSSNVGFTEWLERSSADLAMLRTFGDQGSYVYAGIPWFATIFGRDGLITALETLPFAPAIAAGVLRTLAAMQGDEVNESCDEEPGKILHEARHGEMAALGEIPFRRYYGSIDSTPLFLWVLGEYAERTGDLDLVHDLWPSALRAMEWIDGYGDRDGDGYVEYERRGPRGLVNQGWKDSHDAISYDDGELAAPPIALCEVQAYVYAARRCMAALARRRGELTHAAAWDAEADRLRERFNRDFWMPEEETYALALDGRKRACRVVSSNAGHCLAAGIADRDKAGAVIARLMRDDMFSGFGVRTLAQKEKRYNPMSYHNGSVWPHDTALCAAGFARYGAAREVSMLIEGLFDATRGLENRRLPELFCGFPRSTSLGPVPYPVACQPQAWAAGSAFLLLQSVLGLRLDGFGRRVIIENSAMPDRMASVELRGLAIADASVDLHLARGRNGPAIEVVDKRGEIEVVVRQ
jgi:glycogen debranching enzyme